MGLTISGGGGGTTTYRDLFSVFRAGRYYTPSYPYTITTTATPGNGTLYVVPFWSGEGCTIDRLGVETTASASVGGVVRLGIWNDSSRYPGTLLRDAGTIDVTVAAAALETSTFTQVLSPDTLYWFGVVEQGAPATQVTLRAASTTGPMYAGPIGKPSGAGSNPHGCYTTSSITGALANFPAGASSSAGTPPIIFFKTV